MLTELSIRNFAIIEELTLEFLPTFTVLTGETGAGKSIILDAVLLVLGGRADKSMIRAECNKAIIEATFRLSPTQKEVILPLLEAEGAEEPFEFEITVLREVRENGRTICRINGQLVSTKLLQEVGSLLVDVHGQGSHLALLHTKSHLPLLDRYANVQELGHSVAQEVSELRKLQSELHALSQDEKAIADKLARLTDWVQEIDEARLEVGEDAELHIERKRLGNVEQLLRFSAELHNILSGTDSDTPSAIDLLSQAQHSLSQLARLDESQLPLLEQLESLVFQLNDIAAETSEYQDSLDFAPERMQEVEERLELIGRLKRRYKLDSIEEILALRDQMSAELNQFENSEQRIAELSAEIERKRQKIGRIAQQLSAKRQTAARKLEQSIESELHDLNMKARFQVDFQRNKDPNGIYVGEERLAFDTTGYDQVEFLLSSNPGEPLKPLAKVASGGETARIMLALKSALAQVDETPTLIFDEIDQGIGGRIGDVVGRKLWGLTAHGNNHQVIIVTHLPQLAAYGDLHYHVRKQVISGRTLTHVAPLKAEERIIELASMIGTDDVFARGGAATILQVAQQAKL